jgi:hypothetical protein
MQRGLYNEDLEQLIKQKADQYKMYPSDKVWKGVYRSLHTRRKWYWFSFVLFISAISYYAVELISPNGNKSTSGTNPSILSTQSENSSKKAVVIPFTTASRQTNSIAAEITLKPSDITVTPDIAAEEVAIPDPASSVITINDAAPYKPAYNSQAGRLQEDLKAIPDDRISLLNENYPLSFNTPAIGTIRENKAQADIVTPNTPPQEINSEDNKRINWLQEFAAYEFAAPALRRFSWQLSFSPTMNFRRLAGSNIASTPSDAKNIPLALNIEGDPNKLLNHKPALGFEMGSHFLYAVNKTFTIKAGLQFNYSRYDIQAYSSNSSERATITLNSVSRTSFLQDTISSYTNLRNFGGDAQENLRNQYYQLSAPIGLEFRILGNDKLQLNVAGTLQPTYLLNRNTYLVTTDYKNYTKEPTLVRRWNLNGGAEAFISYNTGELKWQIGPQMRYQLLSTYIKEYPIREHLIEYGVKIGVTKTIR